MNLILLSLCKSNKRTSNNEYYSYLILSVIRQVIKISDIFNQSNVIPIK